MGSISGKNSENVKITQLEKDFSNLKELVISTLIENKELTENNEKLCVEIAYLLEIFHGRK